MSDDTTTSEVSQGGTPRCRDLFSGSVTEMLLLDPSDGAIIDANDAALRFYGYSREQLLSLNITDLSTHSLPEVRQLMDAVTPENGRRFDSRHRLADGSFADLELAMSRVDFGGRTVLHLIILDVTDRKRAELALLESEQRFLDVLHASGDAILLIDGETFVDCNDAAVSMLGCSGRDEVLMMHPSQISPPLQPDGQGSFEKASDLLGTALSTGFIRFEWMHRRPNGEDFLVEVTLTPMAIHGRVVLHVVWRDLAEQKQAEKALQTSRLQLAQAMDLANLVNWDYDVAAREFTFDERFYALYGTTLEREGGSRMPAADYVREFVHADDLGVVAEEIARGMNSTEARYERELEHRIVRRDGQIRHIVVRIEILRDAGGRIVSYHGANQDITQHKEAEEALRASQRLIGGIIDAIPASVYWKDASLTYRGCNRAFARDAGFADPKDIVGKDDSEMGWRDHADLYRETDRRIIESGRSELLIEEPQTTREGKTVTLLTSRIPLTGPGGEISGVLGMHMDITQRKRSEEELKKRNSLIEKLLENSPVGFAIYTVDDRQAMYVSRNFENIYGVPTGSIHSLDDFFEQVYADPCVRETKRASIMASLASGDPAKTRWPDVPITTRSGEQRIITARNIPLPDQNLMISTVQDVTEQKALQTQLSQAQKLESIGNLAAGIAHEINTPTQYVADNTRFLKDAWKSLRRIIDGSAQIVDVIGGTKEGSEAAEQMRAVQQREDFDYLAEQIPLAIDQSLDGLSRIASIVRAMKDFSHPDSDAMALSDINAAIQSTVGVSRNEWKYLAELELVLDPDLPMTPCYLGELNQVVLNLIINAAHAIAGAVKGTQKKGVITVTTWRAEGGMVGISVADTGTGIPESAQPKVFDPFFTTKEVGKGTGQGLAIAYNVVVNHHGGSIGFTTKEGLGTTFTILLPVRPAAEQSGTEAA
jgi:PAS domain S-box-containing protein